MLPAPRCRQTFGARLNTAARQHPSEVLGSSLSPSAPAPFMVGSVKKSGSAWSHAEGLKVKLEQSGRFREDKSRPGQGCRDFKPSLCSGLYTQLLEKWILSEKEWEREKATNLHLHLMQIYVQSIGVCVSPGAPALCPPQNSSLGASEAKFCP